MNEIFWARLTSILFLVSFLFNIIFGSPIKNWGDFTFGLAVALAIYNLAPIFKKYFRR